MCFTISTANKINTFNVRVFSRRKKHSIVHKSVTGRIIDYFGFKLPFNVQL